MNPKIVIPISIAAIVLLGFAVYFIGGANDSEATQE